jgi:hypothetical protein
MIARTLLLSLSIGVAVAGAAESQTQSFDRAVGLARKYTVKVKVEGTRTDNAEPERYGSGVLLSSDGFIATAAHVIGANSEWVQGETDGVLKRTIKVRIADPYGELEDRWRTATFIKDAPTSDVALIKITGGGFARAECKSLQTIRGTDIYRLGFSVGAASSADEKPGTTAVSELPQNFRGTMISEKGMSGGPAIDIGGKVVGIAVNREDNPRFASQSYTEFVRIEEAAALLPKLVGESNCAAAADAGAGGGPPIDITDKLKSLGATSTLVLQYPDQTVTIREGEYILDGRSLRLTAKKLIVSGKVTLRSFAENAAAPSGQTGGTGGPGGQAGGDGQNGGSGLQGNSGATGGDGQPGRPSGAFLLDVADIIFTGDASLVLFANGEAGGRGGTGGSGGPGGSGGAGRNRGGNAICGGSVSPGNGGPGGKGGTGGQGGNGGRGGDGGQIAYSASLADYIADKKLVVVAPGGRGGAGGEHGGGGARGSGGAAGGSSHCGGGGDAGATGTVGDPGAQGQAGPTGSYGDVRGL